MTENHQEQIKYCYFAPCCCDYCYKLADFSD